MKLGNKGITKGAIAAISAGAVVVGGIVVAVLLNLDGKTAFRNITVIDTLGTVSVYRESVNDTLDAYVDMNYPVEFEGEDIAQVLELQKEILQQQSVIKEELEMNEAVNGSGYVTITYRMKDGSVLTRNYTLPSGAEVSTEMFRRIYEWESQADSFLRQFIEYDYESVSRVTDAQLEWYDSSTTNYMYRSVEGDGARALFDAAIADAQAGV